MSKSAVTRLFIGSGIAIIAGAIAAVVAVWLAIENDVFVMAGPDIVGVGVSPLAGSLIGLGIFGGLAMAGGLLGGLISWIGALLNTWRLESKTWFAVLLVLGIFNLGFFAMVGYVIAGPDGTSDPAGRPMSAPAGA
jgi:hypothetical protein